MDIISHILIGKIISFNKNLKTQIWAMFFSFLPDLFQLPAYIYLGYINNRMFFIPKNIDWNHTRNLYPFLHAITWEIPHSIFFAVIIILPIILFFKLPKIALFAYIFHLIIDIPTHSGEWAMKPFYPSNYTFNGFTDVWAWPIWAMALLWIVLIFIILFLNDNALNKN